MQVRLHYETKNGQKKVTIKKMTVKQARKLYKEELK